MVDSRTIITEHPQALVRWAYCVFILLITLPLTLLNLLLSFS
jgi:hypothetical protein